MSKTQASKRSTSRFSALQQSSAGLTNDLPGTQIPLNIIQFCTTPPWRSFYNARTSRRERPKLGQSLLLFSLTPHSQLLIPVLHSRLPILRPTHPPLGRKRSYVVFPKKILNNTFPPTCAFYRPTSGSSGNNAFNDSGGCCIAFFPGTCLGPR